jgi:hypothetical protein
MLRRIRRICCVFMMMGSASLTLAASENTESGRMSAMYSYAPSQALRFEYTKGKIYVEATVNDAHKGKYLLDTGGGFILLDKALAEKMGLKTISLSQIKCRGRGLFADISQNDIFGKETENEKVYS